MNDTTETRTRVIVNFRTSSTKGGQEAYEVTVMEGATQDEADKVMALALHLRAKAEAALTLNKTEG